MAHSINSVAFEQRCIRACCVVTVAREPAKRVGVPNTRTREREGARVASLCGVCLIYASAVARVRLAAKWSINNIYNYGFPIGAYLLASSAVHL